MGEQRNVTMKCEVCGNENFEYDDEKFDSIGDAEIIKCTLCNKVYSKEEIIEANSANIESVAEEIAEELLAKELKKMSFKLK